MDKASIVGEASALFEQLAQLDDEERMDAINEIRLALHGHSPMKEHPVDCVLWVKQEAVESNQYNPNVIPPPEMELLKRSVLEDGYTQPVVVWQEHEDGFEVVDGHHRKLTAHVPAISKRVQGRLPITILKRTGIADRMASTIRHNRARGSHSIDLMQDIVTELVSVGMSDGWIMKHIGMDVDELLRLKQLTGLAALFKDAEFSRSWVAHEDDTNGTL